MKIFEPAFLGNVLLKNRLIQSATYEGMCDEHGFPLQDYINKYANLAKNDVGGIITGFAFVNKEGKAMQPGQAGMDHEDKIPYYKKVTEIVHQFSSKIFMQLAHAGRQTRTQETKRRVVGASLKKSFYFKSLPEKLTTNEVNKIIHNFAQSAFYSQKAGFDGIQLHAAHGYLIHQFLLPSINTRKDIFKINPKTKLGTEFLERIIDHIREKCGANYPILVKVSGSDDYLRKFSKKQFIDLILFLNNKKVDGIEISYGTMDYALNIVRGDIPTDVILNYNPIFRIKNRIFRFLWKILIVPFLKLKIKRFKPIYNLKYAKIAKKHTHIPLICVGGFRKGKEIKMAIEEENINFISMCRPFIAEPDIVHKMKEKEDYISQCSNCNICFIMCDTSNPTKCYQKRSLS